MDITRMGRAEVFDEEKKIALNSSIDPGTCGCRQRSGREKSNCDCGDVGAGSENAVSKQDWCEQDCASFY